MPETSEGVGGRETAFDNAMTSDLSPSFVEYCCGGVDGIFEMTGSTTGGILKE